MPRVRFAVQPARTVTHDPGRFARHRDRCLRRASAYPPPLRAMLRRRARHWERRRLQAILARYRTAPAAVWTAPFETLMRADDV